MNNRLLLAGLAIVVVVIAGAAFLSMKKSANTPAAQTPAPSEATTSTAPTESTTQAEEVQVELTSTGFSPKDITIDKGTKVVWTNNSGAAATVDSAPHPVHTSYPPLNLGSFQDGETHEFTFEETGTFKYHNHFNAGQTGSVTVK